MACPCALAEEVKVLRLQVQKLAEILERTDPHGADEFYRWARFLEQEKLLNQPLSPCLFGE